MKHPKPVVIDGLLWVLIAVCACAQQMLTGEEAYKYVNPYVLFWLNAVIACVGAGAGALKMFRSTAFAKHREEVKTETQFLRKDP